MLDDLRKDALQHDFDDFEEDEEAFALEEVNEGRSERGFLGMTAVERMFLAIFFFLNVLVLGLVALVATGRIVF
jgi:hypothetical protein